MIQLSQLVGDVLHCLIVYDPVAVQIYIAIIIPAAENKTNKQTNKKQKQKQKNAKPKTKTKNFHSKECFEICFWLYLFISFV